MSGTPQRRSTRATKEPERLAPSTPVTPRKRGKAPVSKKASAFASPISSPIKRQRVVAGPSKSKRREVVDSSEEEEEEEVEDSDEAASSEEEELSDFEESRPAP
ncbi:hypothetical protein GGH13_009685, partial [Coemansia sp. S155-1]